MAKKQDDTQSETQPSVIGPNTAFTLTFPWSEVKPVYTRVLAHLAKHVKNPGFRPGKVPPKIAEETIGYSRLVEEALKEMLPKAYQDALSEKNLHPITQPEFNPQAIEKNQDWVIGVEIAEKPEVDIKGYEKFAKAGKKAADKELKEYDQHHQHHDEAVDDEHAKKHEDDKKEIVLKSIFKEMILGLKPTLPELLVKEEVKAELEKLVKSLRQFQLTLDDYLSKRQMTFEDLTAEISSQVLSQLQVEFILEGISKAKKFPIKDEEYEVYFKRIEDEQTRKQYQENTEYRTYLTRIITREKVIDHLLNI
jgi:FKBP-type peptidyl-prolyl cis-trans isomerase (trigger factor)